MINNFKKSKLAMLIIIINGQAKVQQNAFKAQPAMSNPFLGDLCLWLKRAQFFEDPES
jgi:hypothetical protein